jgi:hypothetical protein
MWILALRVTVNESASGDTVHQKHCERRREDRYANRDEAGDVVCKFVHSSQRGEEGGLWSVSRSTRLTVFDFELKFLLMLIPISADSAANV